MEDTMTDDGIRTPTMKSVNVADAFDWQQRANVAEHKLMIQQSKLAREKGKNRRLRSQHISNIKGWTVTTHRLQGLINSNYGYSQEVLRMKSAIEVLEAMIQRLIQASRFIDNR
jgi:CYTH domain-containing protein